MLSDFERKLRLKQGHKKWGWRVIWQL
jgi:hypothetical protein